MDQMPNTAEPEKPRIRWFQFRLRTLLLCATLVAAILCTVGMLRVWDWAQHRNDEQKLIRLRELL